jgi:DNA repair exonuclease SbcCD ATPase subunit
MESVREPISAEVCTETVEVSQDISTKEKTTKKKKRRKRRVYTEYEDALLTKVLDKKPGERKQEIERLAELFQVPYLTLRHRFYTVIKRRADEQRKNAGQEKARESVEKSTIMLKEETGKQRPGLDPMEEILTLPARVERIEKRLYGMLDLKGFIERLISIQQQLEREQQLLETLAKKEREIERIRNDIEKRIEQMKTREEELDDLYKQLEVTFQHFMNLSSLDKLRVLGDFTIKIETVVDKFGNIIRRRPVVVP